MATQTEQAGFQVGNFFYPLPMKFKMGDPVLVEELTGLEWEDFIQRLPDEDEADTEMRGLDPRAYLGLFAVAVWHANPTWQRSRVIRYSQSQDANEVQLVGPESEENVEGRGDEPDDARPPEMAKTESGSDGESTPLKSVPPSDSDSGMDSEPSTQPTTGTPVSATGSQD